MVHLWYIFSLQKYLIASHTSDVHHVPVCFSADDPKVITGGYLMTARDALLKLQWADQTTMAEITQNANKFADVHLSQHGMRCYSIQLFDEYASCLQIKLDCTSLQRKVHFRTAWLMITCKYLAPA